MAKTRESHREDILTGLKGRRLGLTEDEWLVGPKGLASAVTNATSDTTGTALLSHGTHTVATTTNDTWTLAAPDRAGCRVTITTINTSTGRS